MRVLALISVDACTRLRSLLQAPIVLRVASFNEVRESLRSFSNTPVIVDPSELRADAIEELTKLLIECGTPVLVHSTPHPLAVARIVALAQRIHVEVVLAGAEDEALLIRTRLMARTQAFVPALVLNRLAPRLSQLPVILQVGLVGLYCGILIPQDRSAFSSRVAMGPANTAKLLRRVGMRGVSRILTGARIARLWERIRVRAQAEVQYGPVHVIDMMRAGQFSSIRTLESQCRRLIRSSPARGARVLSDVEVATRLYEFLILPAS